MTAPAAMAEDAKEVVDIPAGADREAWMLLKSAHDARQVMPETFVGFDAKVSFVDDDKESQGTISFRTGEKAKLKIDGLSSEQFDWLQDKLLSLIGHRRGGDFRKRDGANPLTFAKEPENNFGRLIELNDSMNSSYRVKNGKVLEVTRCPGKVRFTISVIETQTADPGKYLANHFVVSYRDKKTNALQSVEGFRDSYKAVDGVWLPARRTVVSVTPEHITPQIRRIVLSEVTVAKPASSTASP